MSGIFLSYARENRRRIETLANALEAAGHEVWWDLQIDSGKEFSAEIESALDKAEIVLVAWSKESVASRWVRDEASIGADTGRLVPISIDGTQPPMGFRQFNTADFTGWKGEKGDERTADLLRSIQSRLKQSSSVPTPPEPGRKQPKPMPKRTRMRGIALALILLIVAGFFVVISDRDGRGGGSAVPTIALLPFTHTSADTMVGELAILTRDSIAHAFSESGVPIKLISSAPASGSVESDYLINGEFSAKANEVSATIRMEDATHRVTVFSKRFNADRESARDLPERIGVQVAGSLSWAGALRLLDRRNEYDPVHIASILQHNDYLTDSLRRYELARRDASEYPDSAMAQLALAFYTAFALNVLPHDQRESVVLAARRASQRAAELWPDFGDIYIPGCLLHSDVRKTECEDQLRTGKIADPGAPFVNQFLSELLWNVGRTDEAYELAKLSYAQDPYYPTKIALMLQMHDVAGNSEEADSLYAAGMRWWPEFSGLFWSRMAGITARGDIERLARFEQEFGGDYLAAGDLAGTSLVAALESGSLDQLKQSCASVPVDSIHTFTCIFALAKLGDMDSAFSLTDQLYITRIGQTPEDEERIWLDDPSGVPLGFITSQAAEPLRRDPRYIELVKRVGLLDYWRSGRAPDFCRKQPEPICEQLLK